MTYREGAFYAQEQWVLEVEGCEVRVEPEQTGADLEPGDLYVAERNTGPQLLTCKTLGRGWIHPEELAYSYDLHECRKVVEIDGEPV